MVLTMNIMILVDHFLTLDLDEVRQKRYGMYWSTVFPNNALRVDKTARNGKPCAIS